MGHMREVDEEVVLLPDMNWLASALPVMALLPEPKRGPRRDNTALLTKYFTLVMTEVLLNRRRNDQIHLSVYHIRREVIKRRLGQYSINDKRYFWLHWFEQQPFSLYKILETGTNLREENTIVKLNYDLLSNLELESVPKELIARHFNQTNPDNTGDIMATPIDLTSLRLYIDRTRESIQTKTRWSKQQRRMVHAYPDWIKTAEDNLIQAVQIQKLTEDNKLDQPFKFSPFGRMYLTGVNLQNCSKTVRHVSLGHCFSIDFSVCSAAWRLHTAQQIDPTVTAPLTLYLIKDKQQFRSDLATVLGDGHLSNAKQILTAIGFGADINSRAWPMNNGNAGIPAINQIVSAEQVDALKNTAWFMQFITEQNQLNKIICDNALNQLKSGEVVDCVKDAAGRIQRNKVMAYLYQHAETEYLNDLLDYINTRFGRDEILLTVHDCIYIKHSINMAEVNSRLSYQNPYLRAEITEHWGQFEQQGNTAPELDQHQQQADDFLNYWKHKQTEGHYSGGSAGYYAG
jgi:hypothetical protein